MPIIDISAQLLRMDARLGVILGNVNTIEQNTLSIRNSQTTTYNIVNRIETRDDVELLRNLREASRKLQELRQDLLEFREHNDEGHQTTLNSISDLTNRINNRADSIVERIQRSTAASVNRSIAQSNDNFQRTNRLITDNGNVIVREINTNTNRTVSIAQTRLVGVIETESIEVKGLLALLEASLVEITAYSTASRLLILGGLGGIEISIDALLLLCRKILTSGHNNKVQILNKIGGSYNSVFSKIADSEKTVTDKIENSKTEINTNTNEQIKTLTEKIDNLEEHLKEELSKLPDTIASEVSLNIVGQSYYKWDAISQYFPTITFLFREINVTNYPRHSQIKLRLKKKNTEITNIDIEQLRFNVQNILGLSYLYGEIRSVYVSTDKRWKTSIFAAKEEDSIKVLEALCEVIEEPFNNKNLSFTTNRQRTNPFKRTIPLSDVAINDVSYTTPLKLELFKVVLLVNGLKHPIIIYKA